MGAVETDGFRAAVDPSVGPAAVVELVHDLRDFLRAQDLAGNAVDESLIAVGEACANAVEHSAATARPGRPAVEVTAQVTGVWLRVRVIDTGRWLDRPVPDPAYRNRGRGRKLMAGLVDRLELSTGPAGTVVQLTKALKTQTGTGRGSSSNATRD